LIPVVNSEIKEKDSEEETLSLSPVVKREFQPSFNMAPYVNESPILSNLVKIGVSLAEIEKKERAADIIIKLDFEKDVQPFLLFLKDVAVDDESIGRVITRNPYLLDEDLQDLKVINIL
jgi:mTERF domain-containing protein